MLLICLISQLFIHAQEENPSAKQSQKDVQERKENAITIGFLKGGGSLLGADLEVMMAERFAVQFGVGFIGFGAGLNYHLKPEINSSYVSLQYWNQGFGRTFSQNLIGPSFVFRAKKIFAAQLGFAAPLSKGPAFPANKVQPPIMLTYAVGLYFPF